MILGLNRGQMPETDLAFVDLAPGERLLWSGGPRRGLTLRARDVPQLPFFLLWTGMVGYMAVRAFRDPRTGLEAKLMVVTFLALGLRITAWPLARGAWRRARTRYALTTERVVVAVAGAAPTVIALKLGELPYASLTEERRDGSGTVAFGWTAVGRFLPAGPPRGSRRYGEPPPAPIAELELIPDARRVYGLVVDAQRALRLPAAAHNAVHRVAAPEGAG